MKIHFLLSIPLLMITNLVSSHLFAAEKTHLSPNAALSEVDIESSSRTWYCHATKWIYYRNVMVTSETQGEAMASLERDDRRGISCTNDGVHSGSRYWKCSYSDKTDFYTSEYTITEGEARTKAWAECQETQRPNDCDDLICE